jgi:hypothetical protein
MTSLAASLFKKTTNAALVGEFLISFDIKRKSSSSYFSFEKKIISFDCPNYQNLDKRQCHYQSKSLNPGEVLNDFQHSDTCEAKCYCNLDRRGGASEFICTRLNCNDKLSDFSGKKCINQYDNDNCCAINRVCGKFDY